MKSKILLAIGIIALFAVSSYAGRQATVKQASVAQAFSSLLDDGPGAAYRRVSKQSHYYRKITLGGDGIAGRSRRWGDASTEVKCEVIRRTIVRLTADNCSESEICLGLSILYCECGFNPDAAAGSSSASGGPQFIDATRKMLRKRHGIISTDPFDFDADVVCFSSHLRDCFRLAEKSGFKRGTPGFNARVYGLWHDGPSLKHGGEKIARQKVLPKIEPIRKCLRQVS